MMKSSFLRQGYIALRKVRKRASSTAAVSLPRLTTKFQNPIAWYSNQLDVAPLRTKCLSAGLISGLGQICSQKIMHDPSTGKEFRIDWGQTGRFMVLNVIFVAPVLHKWYGFIDRAIPGKKMTAVVKRVFYDEFVFTPLYIPVLMGSMWSMEGQSPAKIPKMIGAEFWNIMLFDWIVYIPVQLVNFRFVPVKYQVLVINCVGVGWNTFVSWRANHQQQLHADADANVDVDAVVVVEDKAEEKPVAPEEVAVVEHVHNMPERIVQGIAASGPHFPVLATATRKRTEGP